MWINGILVVCGAFLFFLLVSGCILKIGRNSLCNSLIQNVPNVTRLDHTQMLLPHFTSATDAKLLVKRFRNETTSNKLRLCVSFSCDQVQTKQWAAPLKGGKFYNSLYKAEVSELFSEFHCCIKTPRYLTSPSVKAQKMILMSPLCLRPTRRQRGSTSSFGSSSEPCSSSRGVRAPGQR